MYGYRGPNCVPIIREIWIKKDEFGFGFSIAGENPCHINNVVPGSPADRAGLKQMEFIILINGKNVRQLSHENILKELNHSGNVLKLGMYESKLNSSASLGLAKPQMQNYQCQLDYGFENAYRLNREPFHDAQWKGQNNQNVNARLAGKQPVTSAFEGQRLMDQSVDDEGSGSEDKYPLRKERSAEVGLAKNKLRSYCRDKYSEATTKHVGTRGSVEPVQRPLMEKLNNVSDLMKDSPVITNRQKSETSKPKSDKENKAYKQLNVSQENMLQKKENILLQGKEGLSANAGSISWFVVNYISSTDVPIDLRKRSHADTASVAAKRAHSSKGGERVALMFAHPEGIKVINRSRQLIGSYGMESIKWCGEPPSSEEGTMFVIVIASEERPYCSTCHVFRIDQSAVQHSRHFPLARIFGIECSTSSDHTCLEFPKTVDEVICCIAPCVGQMKDKGSSNSKWHGGKRADSVSNEGSGREFLKQEKMKFFDRDQDGGPDLDANEPPHVPARKHLINSQNSILKSFIPTPSKVNMIKNEFQPTPNKTIFTSTPCKPLPYKKNDNNIERRVAEISQNSGLTHLAVLPRDIQNDSNLLQNKSICSSFEGYLDSIEKCNKKDRSNEENEFPKKLSLSSGDINKMQEVDVGRAEQWALNFEFLLNDEAGVATFMEFLKKEYCSENLSFWLKCKNFKQLFNSSNVNNKAIVDAIKKIHDTHISQNAPYEVNIDYNTRKMIESRMNEDPSALCDIFDAAQRHIQQLMKQDKYVRFKTSDLYNQALIDEQSGKPFEHPSLVMSEGILVKAELVNEKPKQEKRKSLLNFWKGRKSFIQSLNENVNQADQQDERCSLKSSGSNSLRPPSLSSTNSLSLKRGKNAECFCGAVLPQTGVVARIPTSNRGTVAECLSKLGSNIDPGMPFIHPVEEENGRLVALSDPSSVLNNKVISFQRLGFLRLDLPGDKPLLIRYKMNLSLMDVIGPVLLSKGFHGQELVVNSKDGVLPKNEWNVSASIFNCKVIAIEKQGDRTYSDAEISKVIESLEANQSASTILALRNLFQDVLPQVSKNSPFATFFCYLAYDEHGASNLDGAEDWFKGQKKPSKVKLFNFIKRASTDAGIVQSRASKGSVRDSLVLKEKAQSTADLPSNAQQPTAKAKEEQKLIKLISESQARSFEGQRGKCSAQYLKLPDFLKEQEPSEDVEICPDLLPRNNKFVIDRRNQRENVELPDPEDAFDLMENDWDDLLNDDDKMSLFGNQGIIPTVEEADFFFSGGASPPPLTIIERGAHLNELSDYDDQLV